jgi:hypothetical protein
MRGNQQAWGQVLGTQSEIGDELAFIDVNVQLNTNLLTVALNPNYEVLIGVLQEVTGCFNYFPMLIMFLLES